MMENQTVPTEIIISENLLSIIQSRKQLNLMLDVALREAAVPQWYPAVDSESMQQILLSNLQSRTVEDREEDININSDIDLKDIVLEKIENTEDFDKTDKKTKKTEDGITFIDSLSQLHALVYLNIKNSNNKITISNNGDSKSITASDPSNCMLLLKPHQIKYTYNSSSSFPTTGYLLLGCSVISVSFIICMLTCRLMPLAGLHFCVGVDFVTPSL
jgi:hypothetical protein